MATIRAAVPKRVGFGILNLLEYQCRDEEHFNDNYKSLKVVGSGSFGEVYKVKSIETGNEYAIKCVEIGNPGENKGIYNMFCQVLQECDFPNLVGDHPNIIKAHPKLNWIVLPSRLDASDIVHVLEVGLDLPLDFLHRFAGTKVYMVFELYQSDLSALLEETQRAAQLDETQEAEQYGTQAVSVVNKDTCNKILCDILYGLCYLHNLGIAHNDFKPNNVLVHYNPMCRQIQDQLLVVIADMGFVQHIGSRPATSMRRLKKHVYDAPDRQTTTKVDIWAFGLVGFHLTYTAITKKGVQWHELKTIGHLAAKKNVSFLRDHLILKLRGQCPFFVESLVQCLHYSPESRPSAEILHHIVSQGESFKEVCAAAQALHKKLDQLCPAQHVEEMIFPHWYRNILLVAIQSPDGFTEETEFTEETKSALQACETGNVFPLAAAVEHFKYCPEKLSLLARALARVLLPNVDEVGDVTEK
ncbi:uncharacterized protein [Watersipora subatra]|uniref:uncharacterized protein n=1 Tax=Watersipora subatra TaxID=2589382 RepID=UPI00355B4DB3